MHILLTLKNNLIVNYILCDMEFLDEEVKEGQIQLFIPKETLIKVQPGKTKYINNDFDFTDNDESYIKDNIRIFRKELCFDIVNRGQVWYNTLTENQKQELQIWYQSWLDAPETLIIPNKPSWLN